MKGTNPTGCIGLCLRIILNWVLEKRTYKFKFVLDSIGLIQGGYYDCSEFSFLIKHKIFLVVQFSESLYFLAS